MCAENLGYFDPPAPNYFREFTFTAPTDATNAPDGFIPSTASWPVVIETPNAKVIRTELERERERIPLNRHERRARDARLRSLLKKRR